MVSVHHEMSSTTISVESEKNKKTVLTDRHKTQCSENKPLNSTLDDIAYNMLLGIHGNQAPKDIRKVKSASGVNLMKEVVLKFMAEGP